MIWFVVSGWHTIHLLLQIAGTAIIVLFSDIRKCHVYSFAWCFAYLTFFRLSHMLGLPSPPSHTNAIILILTLKLVGLAFEVHDTFQKTETSKQVDSDDNTEKEEVKPKSYGSIKPTFSGIIHYTLGHIGLITGPYYKYSVWEGLYHDAWNPATKTSPTWGVCEQAAFQRAKYVPVYVVAFLLSGYFFPLSEVNNIEWQQNTGFWWKVFYMMPIFFNFRMRIYAGFTLSECACIMSGLGAYPVASDPRPGQGPTKLENLAESDHNTPINFETVHNIDEWGSDFVPSMREALRCWNMTVQHWLVAVVYKRFPIKKFRTAAVMLVSSIWHGVHPGYYLSLGSVPLCLMVEDFYRKQFRDILSEKGQRFYDWVGWFVRMRWFDYLGMGFLLLNIDTTIDYWSSVYYAGHVSLVIFGVLGMIVVNPLMKIIIKQDLKEE